MIPKQKAVKLCIITGILAVLVTAGAGSYLAMKFTPVGKVYGILNLLDKAFYKDFDKSQVMEGAAR
ncbi:MAG TPA: hypothetical protein GX524_02745, partial [Firmicutes bacterium]|nr:hypothetical protein [Bacillota bacterium]